MNASNTPLPTCIDGIAGADNIAQVSSFNCRNIKSSIDNVRQLCNANDIIFLQETWLTCI